MQRSSSTKTPPSCSPALKTGQVKAVAANLSVVSEALTNNPDSFKIAYQDSGEHRADCRSSFLQQQGPADQGKRHHYQAQGKRRARQDEGQVGWCHFLHLHERLFLRFLKRLAG